MALAAVALGHTRTALLVPLLNEGEVIGAFVLAHPRFEDLGCDCLLDAGGVVVPWFFVLMLSPSSRL